MNVYPNPVSNILNIRFSRVQRGFLFLVDMSGKCILKSSINNQSHVRLSLKGIETGEYTLKVDNHNHKVVIS